MWLRREILNNTTGALYPNAYVTLAHSPECKAFFIHAATHTEHLIHLVFAQIYPLTKYRLNEMQIHRTYVTNERRALCHIYVTRCHCFYEYRLLAVCLYNGALHPHFFDGAPNK